MRRKREILRIILVVLIAVFLLVGAAALLLAGYRKSQRKEQQRQEAMESLQKIPTVTPTPAVTVTPTATPRPTATPTPVPTIRPSFNQDDYWDDWYSNDGLASVNIYNISSKSVSFYFSQTNTRGSQVAEADVTAEVAGKAAQFSFTDSLGNSAGGNMIFDTDGQLYVRISTNAQAEGASVAPKVNCMMSRERPQVNWEPDPTATPEPVQENPQTTAQTGEYYFPESNSRYLTDEEVAVYSSADLELAKNEIYARRGRLFVTERIADYFNSKSWYQGTIDPETFDAQQDSIFNEYEIANISKIVEWEEKKRSEGN